MKQIEKDYKTLYESIKVIIDIANMDKKDIPQLREDILSCLVGLLARVKKPGEHAECERCSYDERCMEHICNTGNAYLVEECKFACSCHKK